MVMTRGHKALRVTSAQGSYNLVSSIGILFGSLTKAARKSNVHTQDHVFAKFSVKDQIANILVFMGLRVSVTATQLCSCSAKQPQTLCKQMSVTVFQ